MFLDHSQAFPGHFLDLYWTFPGHFLNCSPEQFSGQNYVVQELVKCTKPILVEKMLFHNFTKYSFHFVHSFAYYKHFINSHKLGIDDLKGWW